MKTLLLRAWDRFTGRDMLKGDAKWGAFFASEAFILPSHQENFGIAVAEALACRSPVLLADKVNIAEDIAEDGAGLMELDTPEGTLRLSSRWMDDSRREQLMAERALSSAITAVTICGKTRRLLSVSSRRRPSPSGAFFRILECQTVRRIPIPWKQIHYNAADEIAPRCGRSVLYVPHLRLRTGYGVWPVKLCRALLYRHVTSPLHAGGRFYCESLGLDWAQLPFLSAVEGLGTVESYLRRPGNGS